ncbi:hypothetical protein [Nostoc sp. 'Lobaria pulmonaria (5183) cyanobiont']|uniref:hypothetical protein n=1 Tax=Nostoc sp. 'Lobaria pulmonaria (5183) cyanobiont' TaxID=1618022 RepID=UPI000CF31847|nr:hypothetical protein [Nostoc sp. 'Lobaria pulmonaria (5183) cyanobiont']AVH71574.1 hypothetical protein NLP_2983 [Nostoc sp. 'Lobaria pulmonaria (5183) cyanobiont']
MNVTDTKPVDIITRIGNFNHTQAIGLNCLIFLAVREQTTVTYQYEELGFEDIPQQIVTLCDRLDDDALLDLAGQITFCLVTEKTAAALEEENAQLLAAQAIDDQKQPTLLSDY